MGFMTNTETGKLIQRLLALLAIEGDARAHGYATPAIESLSDYTFTRFGNRYRVAKAVDGTTWLAIAHVSKPDNFRMCVPASHLSSYSYL